jgi:hypothetical protein
MSESFNVQTVHLPLGAFSGTGEVALMRVPVVGGGITVLEANAYQNGTNGSAVAAGTAIGLKLVTFGTVGAPGTAGTVPTVNGTIGSFAGTVYLGAGTVHVCTIGTPYVGPGYFIGIDETAGTIAAGMTIEISYVLGK